MTFLAPLWLFLAAAAGVPLLLHLMRRRTGRRVEFPAVRYVERAEREHSRALRLRNLLLMLLRVALVLALALAAARPAARWLGAARGPTAVAIVLDNSLSTSVVESGRPVLDRLRDAARRVLDEATPADRFYLVTADGAVRGGTAVELRDALARVPPLDGAGDLPGAIGRAASAAAASGIASRQVVVLTDGQRTSWPPRLAVGDVSVFIWTPDAAAPPDHAVVLAEARPARWTPAGAIAFRTTSSTRDSLGYRITLGAHAVARGSAAPGAEVVVPVATSERGWLAGSVSLAPDELPGDDVRHFAVWVGAAPAVHATAGAGPFVTSGLAVLATQGRATGGSAILAGPADEIAARPALFTAPASPARLGAANRALERLGIPWRFGAPVAQSVTPTASDSALPPLAGVGVTRRYPLVAQPGSAAETLAVVGREPWIVAGAGYVLVGSPLAVEATSFPVRAAFLPWLSTLVTRLAGAPGAVVRAAPGAALERPAWATALEADGVVTPLDARFTAPAKSGSYFYVNDGRRVGALVIDPEENETVLDRLSAAALRERVEARQVTVQVNGGSAWVAKVFAAGAGRSLVGPLLALALVLLIVETIAARALPRTVGEARA